LERLKAGDFKFGVHVDHSKSQPTDEKATKMLPPLKHDYDFYTISY